MPLETTPAIPAYDFRTEPYKHQSFDGLLRHWDATHWGYLLEMGAGKSKILIDNFCILAEQMRVDRLLIVAPKGVYANWVDREIPVHMPERHLKDARVHMWKGGHSVTERKQLEWLMASGTGLRILVVNDEAVATSSRLEGVMREFIRGGATMMVVDESSRIKNPTAKRTTKLISIGRGARYRRIMTGTPVANSPLDLWAQFEFLHPAALGHRSYWSFRSRYAIMEKTSVDAGRGDGSRRDIDLVVGHRDTDQISRKVATMATVLRKEDCLDLPPKVYSEWEVQLTAEQTRAYGELRKYATTELEAGRFVTTTQVITMLLRLHQIVCGHTMDDDGQIVEVPTHRPRELLQILESIGDRTIIWANYRHDIERIMEAVRGAGLRAVRYDGGTSNEDRRTAIHRFQDTSLAPQERADVFVGTQSAGGYGITLTQARCVVYYSNNYDLEKRLQSEDRAHRIGQTHSVPYIDMVARGTVDEKIMRALKAKEQLANLVMDGPARIRDLFG